MSEKKKNAMIWILIILSFILMGIIMYITITYRAKQDEAINYYKQQLAIKQTASSVSNY